jgi:ubiquinone/menaquinone biosynthesis C-methylase UbiE
MRQRLEEGPICDPVFIRHYWRLSRRPSRGAARWVAAKMRKLGVPPTARVLDVGCGPGWLARFLAAHFPAMQFVGLDASEPMVMQARQSGEGVPASVSVRFVVGDGCRLPFQSGRFDFVVSGATLHHVADPVAFFDEIDRVLARGGSVIVSDLNRNVPRLLWPLVRLADWIERQLRPAAVRQLTEGFVSSYEAAYSPDEIRAFLRRSRLGQRVCHYPRLLQHWIQTPPRGNGQRPDVHPLEQRVRHDGT